jgi:hypothetical protein
MNILQVYEGWRNKLLPPNHLKLKILEVAEERMNICNECDWNSANRKDYNSMRPDIHCIDCGCTLSAKTKCLSCTCGKGFWKAELTEEQEANIKEHENTEQ